mgnify:CR=1 FL=1
MSDDQDSMPEDNFDVEQGGRETGEQEEGQTPREAGVSEDVLGAEQPPSIESTKDERTMGLLAHLLGIVIGFLGPLIIWLIKKDESAFVDDQGKEALNFQLTVLIAYVVCFGPLNFVFCIGSFLGLAVWVVAIVFAIMGATRANQGELYRYPICLRMIK